MAPPLAQTLSFPSRRAIATTECNKTDVTHAALDATAARLSDADGGLLPGHVVAITFSGVITVEVVVLSLAVIRSGGVAALLVVDPDVTQGQLELCLSDTGARLLGLHDDAAAPLRLKLNLAGLLPPVPLTAPAFPAADLQSLQNQERAVQVNSRLTQGDLASSAHRLSVAVAVAFAETTDATAPTTLVVPPPLFGDDVHDGLPIIVVGAGPTGLAVAAALRELGMPSIVLERGDCIAPLWRKPSYGILKLPLHKNMYELPFVPLPGEYPDHVTIAQYVDYLWKYAAEHGIEPNFDTSVVSASYSGDTTGTGLGLGLWRVRTEVAEYTSRWLVVATGQHAGDRVLPRIPGLAGFIRSHKAVHVSDYYDDKEAYHQYKGKRVLVVGLGNSALQVAQHLWEHGARPTLALLNADAVEEVPPNDDPISEVDMVLEDWLPAWATADVDTRLVARVVLGELRKLGVRDLRRRLGIAATTTLAEAGAGRTSAVLPYGVASLIRDGHVGVVRAVDGFGGDHASLVDGSVLQVDAVVLATGLCSALPKATWHAGYPGPTTTTTGPDGWDGRCGLYAVGFSKRSFAGDKGSPDAVSVAADIARAAGMNPGDQGRAAAARVHVTFASYPRNAGPDGA